MLPLSAIFSGKVPGLDVPGNRQARFGYPTFGPTALVSPIVGMAQGAIDAFTETARGAKRMARPGVFEKVAESQLIQSLIGQTVGAGRCGANLDGDQPEGRPGRRLQRRHARHRTARAHPAQSRLCRADLIRSGQRLFAKVGAAAADEKNRVQRFWRDANTAALHASIDWDTLSALYGTQQLGLQPQGIF